jgi:hypothetical protein
MVLNKPWQKALKTDTALSFDDTDAGERRRASRSTASE